MTVSHTTKCQALFGPAFRNLVASHIVRASPVPLAPPPPPPNPTPRPHPILAPRHCSRQQLPAEPASSSLCPTGPASAHWSAGQQRPRPAAAACTLLATAVAPTGHSARTTARLSPARACAVERSAGARPSGPTTATAPSIAATPCTLAEHGGLPCICALSFAAAPVAARLTTARTIALATSGALPIPFQPWPGPRP